MEYNLIQNNRPIELFHTSTLVVTVILLFLQLTVCASDFHGGGDYFYDVPTESPDLVETFNPQEWVSKALLTQQVEIQALKMATQIKLRYARTRITVQLRNQHDKEVQADFKLVLPENAFFTTFELKKGNSPKTFSAKVVEKEVARNIFHFARTRTNGTVSAGYIELSPKMQADRPTYNLKFTLSPREKIHAFLVYERQLDRVADEYTDKIQVFPILSTPNSTTIGLVEFAVNVEELEDIQWLRCTDETEANFSNCSSRTRKKRKRNGKRHKYEELSWRARQVEPKRLELHPFQFAYKLEQQNDTTTAVVISQHNGNMYFLHLIVPENLPPIRKHFVFLLDVSDSMHGQKSEQLRWSMIEILDDLGPDDFFNIVAFSNDITVWSKYRGDMSKCPYPYPATDTFKDSAYNFINTNLTAHGTTNIYLGLSTAFDLIRLFSPETQETCSQSKNIKSLRSLRGRVSEKLPENVESMIFFLSDGQATSGPTDSASLLKYFHQLNHNSDDGDEGKPYAQIHAIAYGEDADVEFLRTLASLNGGVLKVIVEESAAGTELTNFYKEISLQVLSHVQTSVVTTNNASNSTAMSLPLIMKSSPVTVIKGGEVLTTGQLFPQSSSQSFSSAAFNWSAEGIGKNGKLAYYNSPVYDCTTLEVSIGKCVERIDYYLERLQAYQLLKKLLERDWLVKQGYLCPKSYHDQFQDLKMEYENVGEDVECYNNFQQQATELALKHGFVTAYTSFILTTEQIDTGLRSDEDSVGTSADDDDESVERISVQPPSGQWSPEKLILVGSVSPVEKFMEAPNTTPQIVTLPEILLEVKPNATKMAGWRIASRNVNSNAVLPNATNYRLNINRSNGITPAADTPSNNGNPFKFVTRFMQDSAVKFFKKLFSIHSPGNGSQGLNGTDFRNGQFQSLNISR